MSLRLRVNVEECETVTLGKERDMVLAVSGHTDRQ